MSLTGSQCFHLWLEGDRGYRTRRGGRLAEVEADVNNGVSRDTVRVAL